MNRDYSWLGFDAYYDEGREPPPNPLHTFRYEDKMWRLQLIGDRYRCCTVGGGIPGVANYYTFAKYVAIGNFLGSMFMDGEGQYHADLMHVDHPLASFMFHDEPDFIMKKIPVKEVPRDPVQLCFSFDRK